MQEAKGLIRTKMSAALIKAVEAKITRHGTAGHVGAVVLTAQAKGTGVKFAPRTKPVNKKFAALQDAINRTNIG
jgi:hypothetical protein